MTRYPILHRRAGHAILLGLRNREFLFGFSTWLLFLRLYSRSYLLTWPLHSWKGRRSHSKLEIESYFNISVQYFKIMKSTQSLYNLNENIPNLVFFKVSPSFLVIEDFLEEITSVSVLHDDAASRVTYQRDLVGGS